jgi:hypothetical protein
MRQLSKPANHHLERFISKGLRRHYEDSAAGQIAGPMLSRGNRLGCDGRHPVTVMELLGCDVRHEPGGSVLG